MTIVPLLRVFFYMAITMKEPEGSWHAGRALWRLGHCWPQSVNASKRELVRVRVLRLKIIAQW